MPAIPKSGPALFLGLELATDQIRASIVDESLELVGVECVDFDTELPEYKYVPLYFVPSPLRTQSIKLMASFRTQGGIFTTPGDAYTTPVEMWIKGLGEHPFSISAEPNFFLRGVTRFFSLPVS